MKIGDKVRFLSEVGGRILSSRRQIYSKAQGVQYLSAAFMLFYPKHPFHFGKYT